MLDVMVDTTRAEKVTLPAQFVSGSWVAPAAGRPKICGMVDPLRIAAHRAMN